MQFWNGQRDQEKLTEKGKFSTHSPMSGHSPRRGFGCLLASAGQYFKPPTRLALVAQMVKCLSAMLETWVRSLGGEDPLEKEMATHSSTLSWKIPWTKEPGRLQSMRLQRVGHNWETLLTQSFWGIAEPQSRAQSSFCTHFGTSLSFYIHTQAHCRINKVKQKTCIPRKQRGWSSECSYLVLKILDEPPRW